MHWRANCRVPGWRPKDIPSNPRDTYGSEVFDAFGGWSGFLNIQKINQRSKIERMLRYVLDDCFDHAPNRSNPKIRGKSETLWSVDFVDHRSRLAVEYDGAYYHENRFDEDRRKTTDLVDAGWLVIRVRSHRAHAITPDVDVCIDQRKTPAVQISSVLRHIMTLSQGRHVHLGVRVQERIKGWTDSKLQSFNFRDVLQRFDGYRPIKEAMRWVKEQNVASRREWQESCAKPGWLPEDIPASPAFVYGRDEFRAIDGWGGWLGTGTVAVFKRKFRPLAEAATWAKGKNLNGQKHWQKMIKTPGWLPSDIPQNPWKSYGADAFNAIGGWGGFLGTGYVAHFNRSYRPLLETVNWIQAQDICSVTQWNSLCKIPGWLPNDIPQNLYGAYGDEFREFGSWSAITGNQKGTTPKRRRGLKC